MWVRQYSNDAYDQDGYYSIQAWENKPTLIQLARKPLEELNETELITVVSLYKGEVVIGERIVEVQKDGTIPFEF